MKFTEDQIDRGIFEAIRKQVIAMGYLYDEVLFESLSDSEFEQACKNAGDAIVASGKKVIQVFGCGDIQARDEVENNKIVISRDDFVKGSLGFVATESFVLREDGDYDHYQNQSGTITMQYQISYVTDDSILDRRCHSAIINALGSRMRFVYGINEDASVMTRGFNTAYLTTLNKSGQNYTERALRYNVPDVCIEEAVYLGIVPAMNKIQVETAAVKEKEDPDQIKVEFEIPES